MEKFGNKYRISSARLAEYNYSQNGAYFITICTKNRENYFGDIIQDKIELSAIGKIVAEEWLKTSKIRKEIILGQWVVMPNHFHAIVMIDKITNDDVETHGNASQILPHNASQILPDNPSQTLPQKDYKNKFGPQRKNLSSLVRGFKGIVTIRAHKDGFDDFVWQSRFHDRIIRDEKELQRISEYIINNPKNWKDDVCY